MQRVEEYGYQGSLPLCTAFSGDTATGPSYPFRGELAMPTIAGGIVPPAYTATSLSKFLGMLDDSGKPSKKFRTALDALALEEEDT